MIREGSDKPGQLGSLTRAFTARIPKRDKDNDLSQLSGGTRSLDICLLRYV